MCLDDQIRTYQTPFQYLKAPSIVFDDVFCSDGCQFLKYVQGKFEMNWKTKFDWKHILKFEFE